MDRSRQSGNGRRLTWGLLALVTGVGIGCASFSNPTLPDAIPVNRLPLDVLGSSREAEKTIPLTLLRQDQPKNYLLDAGDILGVFVEGVLGERGSVPPIINLQFNYTGTPPPPAVGFPIPVGEDGTLVLPLFDPIDVRGKSGPRRAGGDHQGLHRRPADRPGGPHPRHPGPPAALPRDRHPAGRRHRRRAQRRSITSAGGQAVSAKRGTGYPVDLNAYENDVLNALARTGGLPGLDASNTIVIQRSSPKTGGAGEDSGPGLRRDRTGPHPAADAARPEAPVPARGRDPQDRRHHLHRVPRHRGLLHRRPAAGGRTDPAARLRPRRAGGGHPVPRPAV